MMFGYGFNMSWMWLWGLLALAGLVLLLIVIVRAAGGGIKRTEGRGFAPAVPSTAAMSTPRQVLDERYARGELTTEEYRERLTVLGEDT